MRPVVTDVARSVVCVSVCWEHIHINSVKTVTYHLYSIYTAVQTSNWPVSCTGHYMVRPAPQYLADDVQLLAVSGRRLLRSANYRTCVVPRTQNSFRDRDFSVARPRIWNDLPPELQHVDVSFGQFRNMLKSYLFGF